MVERSKALKQNERVCSLSPSPPKLYVVYFNQERCYSVDLWIHIITYIIVLIRLVSKWCKALDKGSNITIAILGGTVKFTFTFTHLRY